MVWSLLVFWDYGSYALTCHRCGKLVMDNARYQRCDKVMDKAKELGIDLLFLPPYSPNLNLIERLWKFTKKQCLYNRYYETVSLCSNTPASPNRMTAP